MNTTEIDTAAILNQAADYLDTHGWCQGDLYQLDEHCENLDTLDARPSACALGALYITVSGTPVTELCLHDPVAFRRAEAAAALVVDTLGLVRLAARDEPVQPVDELVWWNDGSMRTAQEVVDTFRRIAADHRSERAS